MDYCTNCGTELSGNEEYCGECGAALTQRDVTNSNGSHVSSTEEETLYQGNMSWPGALFQFESILTLWILAPFVRWYSQYTITNREIHSRYGILNKTQSMIRPEDIRDIRLEQDIIDRLFGVGTVEISSAGRSDSEVEFKLVSNPNIVIDVLKRVRDENG
jgi:uncharacterized membrane protein YdbT with pleckstrin-like domain